MQCPGAETNAAVYVWPNGQTDGFLPNKEELDLLFDQKVTGVVGGFGLVRVVNYWSSSEVSSSDAWNQNFGNGDQLDVNKNFTIGVRAVRAF